MKVNVVTRIRLITVAITLVALILIARLYQIQILHTEDYRDMANRQYVHTAVDMFDRGNIYLTTKNGEEVAAATVAVGSLIAIVPTEIRDPEETYQKLSAIIPIDHDDFIMRARKEGDTYEEVASRVSETDGQRIKDAKISGVRVYRDQWRTYPGDDLLSRSIGFVGYDGDELVGRYGLERYYDDVLTRGDGEVSVNFFAEIFSNIGALSFDAGKRREGDIVTTLEPSVSRMLQSELTAVHDTLRSKETGGIVMDPKTGAIYAMSVVPTYNLNDRNGVDINTFRNPLVEDFHEMGSIIKPLTVAAGLDSHAITPATTYYDAGSLTMDGYTIYNYDKRGRGTVPMQEILNQSLNTGVSFIVKQMGRKAFRDYFTALGLGTETGIDLPNETHGRIANIESSPRDIEYATASFGQGIAMTPIETVRALATLGNGGILVNPHIVSKVRLEDGSEQEITFGEDTQVFSAATSEEISRMLTNVVDKALRGGTKKMEHYSVAAKTGTAQIPSPDGGYYDDKYLHSFFGYFPSYDPRFIVFLYTVEPQGVQYASETLTEPFINMVHFLINYYTIPPDR